LKCSGCDDRVICCSFCGRLFEVGDKIFCFYGWHLCSPNCVRKMAGIMSRVKSYMRRVEENVVVKGVSTVGNMLVAEK